VRKFGSSRGSKLAQVAVDRRGTDDFVINGRSGGGSSPTPGQLIDF
jgi:hypothetical protein